MLEVGATETGLWKVAYSSTNALINAGVRVSREAAGEMAFRGDLLKDAYHQWENIEPEQRARFERSFLRARASVSTYPQNLDDFAELLSRHRNRKDADDYLDLVQREGFESLKASHKEMVTFAYLILGDWERVFSSINGVTNIQLLTEALEGAAVSGNEERIQIGLAQLVSVLAGVERWTDLLDLWRKGEMRDFRLEATKRWAAKNQSKFAKPIIEIIAASGKIEEARNDFRTSLAELLRERFGQSFAWKGEVHPLLVGRAFERAGLFKETLPYYEQVAGSRLFSEGTRQLAWVRWARTKWLQSLREREMQATGRADKAYKEAMEKATSCGFRSPEDIPESLPSTLPSIEPDLVEKVAAPKPSQADSADSPPESTQAQPETEAPITKRPSKRTRAKRPETAGRDFARTLSVGALEIRAREFRWHEDEHYTHRDTATGRVPSFVDDHSLRG